MLRALRPRRALRWVSATAAAAAALVLALAVVVVVRAPKDLGLKGPLRATLELPRLSDEDFNDQRN